MRQTPSNMQTKLFPKQSLNVVKHERLCVCSARAHVRVNICACMCAYKVVLSKYTCISNNQSQEVF